MATVAVLVATVAALEQRLARFERLERFVWPLDERAFLAQLARSTGGRIFSTRELRQHARVDQELAAMLERFPSAKGLGKYLRTLAAAPPPGAFVLERVLRERAGWLWKVSARED